MLLAALILFDMSVSDWFVFPFSFPAFLNSQLVTPPYNSPKKSQNEMPSSPWKLMGSTLVRMKGGLERDLAHMKEKDFGSDGGEGEGVRV